MREITSVIAEQHAYCTSNAYMVRLVLSPSRHLAQPRSWQNLAELPQCLSEADEVVCLGGGSLLLWLLVRAGRCPRRPMRNVVMHGPLVLPTPESCGRWLSEFGEEDGASTTAESQWREQALLLGLNGGAEPWLRPILQQVAMGRFDALQDDMLRYVARWSSSGRLTICEPQLDADFGAVALCCDSDSEDGTGVGTCGIRDLPPPADELVGCGSGYYMW